MTRQQKITLGEMRESRPRRLLVYCADYRCVHSVLIDVALNHFTVPVARTEKINTAS